MPGRPPTAGVVRRDNAGEVAGHLYIKTGYEQVKVLFEDILYLEAAGNYVTFVLRDRNLLSRSTFAEAAAGLPSDKFVRVHRSYLVALDKIDKVERHQVTVKKLSGRAGETGPRWSRLASW